MRHRILAPVTEAPLLEIRGDELHHAVRVVRVRTGEEVEVFDGNGSAVRGTVETIDRDVLRVRVTGNVATRESGLNLTLAMAILQLDRFEMVLQKATELGAGTIIPLVTSRGEVRRERYEGKRERWEKIILEAAKQSGRERIPRLAETATFSGALASAGAKAVLFEAMDTASDLPDRLTDPFVFIGPEGGWTPEELEEATNMRTLICRLGPRRLRGETAAIVALSILGFLYGDLAG